MIKFLKFWWKYNYIKENPSNIFIIVFLILVPFILLKREIQGWKKDWDEYKKNNKKFWNEWKKIKES